MSFVGIYSSHLQIREVTFLPVVHEDKIQPFQAILRPQLRDDLIRWIHNELHLETKLRECLRGKYSPYSIHETKMSSLTYLKTNHGSLVLLSKSLVFTE